MKKILLILVMCLLLTGCSTRYQQAEITNNDFANGYFTELECWNDGYGTYRIIYANDTGVKYFYYASGDRGAMTPLYNADGTLQVYKEE